MATIAACSIVAAFTEVLPDGTHRAGGMLHSPEGTKEIPTVWEVVTDDPNRPFAFGIVCVWSQESVGENLMIRVTDGRGLEYMEPLSIDGVNTTSVFAVPGWRGYGDALIELIQGDTRIGVHTIRVLPPEAF